MTKVDELRELARTEPAAAGEPTVALRASDGPGALVALLSYFGGDEGRTGVSLAIDGELVGHVHRSDILGLVSDATRGGGPAYGSSAGMQVPGHEAFRLLRLRCPVVGCPEGDQLQMNYNEDDPPVCSIHRDVVLALV
jgi:hypothetical protein